MKRITVLAGILLLLFCLPAAAAASIRVAEGVIATGIRDRAPVGAAGTFPDTVDRLTCFTRIAGAGEDTVVTHVWLYEGREMARIELPVASADWRTWSSKRILPAWTGAWRVDVLDARGNLLKQIPFTVGSR